MSLFRCSVRDIWELRKKLCLGSDEALVLVQLIRVTVRVMVRVMVRVKVRVRVRFRVRVRVRPRLPAR